MIFAAFLVAAAQSAAPEISVRIVEGEARVDAVAASLEPLEFARRVASDTGRALVGEELLSGRSPLEFNLVDRPLYSVLALLANATRTRVDVDRRTITFSPEAPKSDAEGAQADAEAAWVSLVRDFPTHEAARSARVWLGLAQEKRGHDDAALTHYDAAAHEATASPAAERALRNAGRLFLRRGEWASAIDRLSRLAQSSPDRAVQIEARLGVSHALSEQGRGVEALALLDVVDLSYPARDAGEIAQRRLARAHGHLAAGAAGAALHELDARAVSDPRLGNELGDLHLRARVLEELGSPLEAARAWLACAGATFDEARADSLLAAARLSALGGDDLAVLFIERVARGGSRTEEVTRVADAARVRLGLAVSEPDLEQLEKRWDDGATLSARDRAKLAAELVTETARSRGADAAASVARTTLDAVPAAEGRTIRTALAVAYENEGAWAQAARVWGGTAP